MSGLVFHHLGLAVQKPDAAILFLKNLRYGMGPEIFDPLQKVYLRMAAHQTMPDVEIIWPGAEKSPLDDMLGRHRDGLVYHTCYTTGDLAVSLAQMKKEGLRVLCVAPPQPAVLFGGKPVSFYIVAGMGLIEIIEA